MSQVKDAITGLLISLGAVTGTLHGCSARLPEDHESGGANSGGTHGGGTAGAVVATDGGSADGGAPPSTDAGSSGIDGGAGGIEGTCVPDDAKACEGKSCGQTTNNCGVSVECPDTCVPPAACGVGSVAPNECGYVLPQGKSLGCGKAPATGNDTAYTLRQVTVTGVSPDYITTNPPAVGQSPYTWTNRNYFVRLPANYDENRPYPLILAGSLCGNTEGTAGKRGGLATLPLDQDQAIQIGLSYVYAQGSGACFADDAAETPEPAYLDAVLADAEAAYCVDQGQIFATGDATGADEAALLGCVRANKVRGIGTVAPALRLHWPACAAYPVAAMMVVGKEDASRPLGGPTGSAAARDDILQRNGCSGSQSSPWDAEFPACVTYTDCPSQFPVVWCELEGGHTDGGVYSAQGFWKFWSELPAP